MEHSARPLAFKRLRTFLHRFYRSEDGVTALEFALVAPPFFLLLMGIFEMALIIIGGLVLEQGVTEAARQIRTGEFQSSGGAEAEFRELVCENMFVMVRCNDALHIDVKVFSDFGSTNFSDPTATDEFGEDFGYQKAAPNEVVLVRVFYLHKITTPMLGPFFANYGTNTRVLSWAAAFETEPY